MTVNRINGTLFSGLSALNGRTLSTLSHVNGQAIVGGTTPSDISNIWEWWEPSRETAYANNDAFTTLTGQFASRDWNQGDAAHKCTYKTNIINGLAASYHDAQPFEQGWDFPASVPDPSALTAAHIFIVIKLENDPPTTDFETGIWAFGSSGLGAHYPFSDGKIYDDFGSTTRKAINDPGIALDTWRVYEVISTSSEWTALIDGSQIHTTGTNTVGWPSSGQTALGINRDETVGFQGWIAGAYMFSAKKTGSDRTTLITYINSRFGLSVS